MAMSHADCDHPRTPKDRAACRRRNETIRGVVEDTRQSQHAAGCIAGEHKGRCIVRDDTPVKPAKLTVVPRARRGRHSGVDVNLKRPGTVLRGRPDHADVPRVFMGAIEKAYRHDWPVKVGEVFDHTTRRLIIETPEGDINLAWSASNPNGITRVAWRAKGTSVTTVVATLNGAIRLGMGEEE